MVARTDMTGQRFGRLTVVRTLDSKHAECRCDCGEESFTARNKYLRCGDTKSCGCLLGQVLLERNHRHGMHGSLTYKAWRSMRARVVDDPLYIGRIHIHPRWDDFKNFLSDMGEKPEGMTLDRIDGSKDYEPGNCRWATTTQQSLNRKKRLGGPLPIGVRKDKSGKYPARFGLGYVRYHLGTFDDPELAGLAYQTAKDRWERLGFVRYFL